MEPVFPAEPSPVAILSPNETVFSELISKKNKNETECVINECVKTVDEIINLTDLKVQFNKILYNDNSKFDDLFLILEKRTKLKREQVYYFKFYLILIILQTN